MLSRSHRFHGYGSLKGVYARGTTVRSGAISARFMQRDGTKPYRIAVVVSKKVSKSAVTRNRIRRRLYEIVRHNDSQLAPGTDIIITIFDEQLATIDASAVERQVLAVLNKVAPPVSHAIVNADTSTKGDK